MTDMAAKIHIMENTLDILTIIMNKKDNKMNFREPNMDTIGNSFG